MSLSSWNKWKSESKVLEQVGVFFSKRKSKIHFLGLKNWHFFGLSFVTNPFYNVVEKFDLLVEFQGVYCVISSRQANSSSRQVYFTKYVGKYLQKLTSRYMNIQVGQQVGMQIHKYLLDKFNINSFVCYNTAKQDKFLDLEK